MEEKKQDSLRDNEIDLLSLFKVVWNGRKFVSKVTFVFIIFGLIVALTSKLEYQAYCKLMPESQDTDGNNLGGLGSLAGLAGINLNVASSGSLKPEFYPEIVNSIPFQMALINEPIYFQKIDTTVSSKDYFQEIDSPSFVSILFNYTIGLPFKIKSWIAGPTSEVSTQKGEFTYLIKLSKEDWETIEAFKSRLNVSLDRQTGIISITVQMPDPYAAAIIADNLVRKLTADVIKYKTEKVKSNLDFVQERFLEYKKEYEEKQVLLAKYVDRNRNVTSAIVLIEQERLTNELNASFEVYKGLASQLEQAKIQVKEQTPVFTILEPVKIPVDKIKPKRATILILFTMMGIIVSTLYLIIRNYFKLNESV